MTLRRVVCIYCNLLGSIRLSLVWLSQISAIINVIFKKLVIIVKTSKVETSVAHRNSEC